VDGPQGDLQPAQFYCDQITDGGGWIHIFGQNNPNPVGCDWTRFSTFNPVENDRANEAPFDPSEWNYECGRTGLLFEHRDQTQLRLRMTVETPFEFSSIRYSAQMNTSTDAIWRDNRQLYKVPTIGLRHPRAAPGEDDSWIIDASCEPIVFDEVFVPFINNEPSNSLSWLLWGYSPSGGCREHSMIQISSIAVR
jgi:hypothetical protein